MRTIKFRSKRIDNSKWVYGTPFWNMDELEKAFMITSCQFGSELIGLDGVEIDYKTIGQFTGLTDKNSKEIYEGDVLTDFYGDSVVDYRDGSFVIHDTNDKNAYSLFPEFLVGTERILGNIHDNPELMEGE